MPMTDDSKLTFGMHAGKPLSEVPDKYLLWLYENNMSNRMPYRHDMFLPRGFPMISIILN
jgi:hypothetical protein